MLTTLLSIAAILISLATLYLSFFHKKISMIGVLASCFVPDEQESNIDMEYCLSNTGNKELLIREVSIEVEDIDPQNTLVPEIDAKNLPVILQPGKMQLVEFQVPYKHFLKKALHGNKKIEIWFHVHSLTGNAYTIKHNLQYEESTVFLPKNDSFTSFKLGKPEK